ncbi:MAG TPA: PEP-CTERM/exosortase system-associated acyltransferase, partial [Acidobacteriaceae bacterium]|nr:PEP-CTERM/exosortase system-associated acyltransferase [Acidobacteriaceae bacterium]
MYHSSNRVEQCLFEEQSASNAGLPKHDVLPVHREMPQPSCQPPQFTALQCYDSVFSSAIATSPEKRDQCFRVRFQVYCIDNGFEDPSNSPDGLESDAFDSHSVHAILIHNATGAPIGTVRLVLPDEDGERRMLPMQRIAEAVAIDAVAPFPVWRTAEISRFSIVKSFRHYTPSQGVEAQLSAEEWRKMLFHLPLGLIKSCVEMSVRQGMTHWAAVMEPALLRLLTRLGIHFNPLGPLVEYHGRRQPCWIELGILLDRVHAERPDVWDVITDGGRLWPLTVAYPVA